MAGVDAYRFPNLYGSLHWTPTAFEVWDAGSKLYGGDVGFSYSIAPLGQKNMRPTARFAVDYTDVDLASVTDFEELRGPYDTERSCPWCPQRGVCGEGIDWASWT